MSILKRCGLKLSIPNAERIFYLAQAFEQGASIDEVYDLTKIDKWFLQNVRQIVQESKNLAGKNGAMSMERAKKLGFSDRQLAIAWGPSEKTIRAKRKTRRT